MNDSWEPLKLLTNCLKCIAEFVAAASRRSKACCTTSSWAFPSAGAPTPPATMMPQPLAPPTHAPSPRQLNSPPKATSGDWDSDCLVVAGVGLAGRTGYMACTAVAYLLRPAPPPPSRDVHWRRRLKMMTGFRLSTACADRL